MKILILDEKKHKKVRKAKKLFKVFRAVEFGSDNKLREIEFINTDGTFNGFGKKRKEAMKHAYKVLKKHYHNKK